ncbi:alpha/beta fold hydrolase [Kitasatospora sp. NPDC047058]|uniref:alpha/beta fold hydrolase n=1 Tax=Kitasatospora sp. NPDC047058 TaxID=3155620 RepID=UPI0033F3210F
MTTSADARREAVLRAWRAVLEAEPASEDENFFDAGGNSILAVAFQRRLGEELGHRVTLKQVHENATVAGLLGLDASRPGADPAAPQAPAEALTLYCLAYAGASARLYEPWRERLPAAVTLVPLELPGRGARWTEPAIPRLEPLLADLAGTVERGPAGPYAVFGHSFGALLAYELAGYLVARGRPAPRRLLVSACAAPHEATPTETNHDLTDTEFVERLRRLRGTPEELLENAELMELYLPTIRADYTILDHYRARPAEPLGCPVSAFHGADDLEVGQAEMARWASYGNGSIDLDAIPGDHFFLHDAEEELVAAVARRLGPDLPRGRAALPHE